MTEQGALFGEPVTMHMTRTALLSREPVPIYRYELTRAWQRPDVKRDLWLMLNPSDADHEIDDPTVGRCVGFSRRDGATSLAVGNLHAWRGSSPKSMLAAYATGVDIIGPGNAAALTHLISTADRVIAAWGAHATAARAREVFDMIIELTGVPPVCLGVTKHGAPKHPLYIRGTQPFETYGGPS